MNWISNSCVGLHLECVPARHAGAISRPSQSWWPCSAGSSWSNRSFFKYTYTSFIAMTVGHLVADCCCPPPCSQISWSCVILRLDFCSFFFYLPCCSSKLLRKNRNHGSFFFFARLKIVVLFSTALMCLCSDRNHCWTWTKSSDPVSSLFVVISIL